MICRSTAVSFSRPAKPLKDLEVDEIRRTVTGET